MARQRPGAGRLRRRDGGRKHAKTPQEHQPPHPSPSIVPSAPRGGVPYISKVPPGLDVGNPAATAKVATWGPPGGGPHNSHRTVTQGQGAANVVNVPRFEYQPLIPIDGLWW